MTITVLISVTGYVAVAGTYNYLLPVPILYSTCRQRVPQPTMWFFTWWGDPAFIPKESEPLVVLPGLGC